MSWFVFLVCAAQLIRAFMAWQAAAPQLEALRAAADANCAGLEHTPQQELLLGGSCGGSGSASPPLQQPCQLPVAALGASGSGGSTSSWQQQDTQTLDQLQRSSELLLQLQKQQQRQQWWGGLLYSSSSSGGAGSGSSSGGGWYPSVAPPPAGRSPERASSTSLSVISEDEATCVPHPFQPLRLEGWLRKLDEQQEQQLRRAAAVTAG